MNKTRNTILLGMILGIMSVFALVIRVNAADFTLNPSSGQFFRGCESVVSIYIDTEGAITDAADIIIYYESDDIEIVDQDAGVSGTQIQEGSVYEAFLGNEVDEVNGEIRLTGFSYANPYEGDSGLFAQIVFIPQEGISQTDFTIYYIAGETIDSNIAEYLTSIDLLDGVTNASFTFTDGLCDADTTAPWIINEDPADGQTGVPASSNIEFEIHDDQSGVDINSVEIDVDNYEYSLAGPNVFTYSGDSLNYNITVDPIVDFSEDVIVYVSVDAEDIDGNLMDTHTWSFNSPAPLPESMLCEELLDELDAEGCQLPGCEVCEECSSCEEIPPEEEVPEETISPDEVLASEMVIFWAARRTLRIYPEGNGDFDLLPGSIYSIDIYADDLPKEAAAIWWNVANGTYQLALDGTGTVYQGDITAPLEPASYSTFITIEYEDGTVDNLEYILVVHPLGLAYTTLEEEGQVAVSDASITIVDELTGTRWEASSFYQNNPHVTQADGYFGWLVPGGNYYLEVSAEGYREKTSASFYSDLIVNDSLELVLIPGEVSFESVGQFVDTAEDWIDYGADVAREYLDDPDVQEANEQVSRPLLVGLAAINLAGLFSGLFGLVWWLFLLFTQPLLLLGRRRRKSWGVVYNSLTKRPVDLIIVRLIDNKTNRIVQTQVTDKEGRYLFLAEKGDYRLEVRKPGFHFPSVHMATEKTDPIYLDVYHGEEINVTDNGAAVTANIPVDSKEFEETPHKVRFIKLIRYAYKWLAAVSVIASALAVVITPSKLFLGLLIVHVVMYIVFAIFGRPRKPRGWGIVSEKGNNDPIGKATVRVLEPKYNKVLETVVTDSKGHYAILTDARDFYAVYEKPGFKGLEVRPKSGKPGGIDYNVKMETNSFTGNNQQITQNEQKTEKQESPAPTPNQVTNSNFKVRNKSKRGPNLLP